jgi:hypothetical protein
MHRYIQAPSPRLHSYFFDHNELDVSLRTLGKLGEWTAGSCTGWLTLFVRGKGVIVRFQLGFINKDHHEQKQAFCARIFAMFRYYNNLLDDSMDTVIHSVASLSPVLRGDGTHYSAANGGGATGR